MISGLPCTFMDQKTTAGPAGTYQSSAIGPGSSTKTNAGRIAPKRVWRASISSGCQLLTNMTQTILRCCLKNKQGVCSVLLPTPRSAGAPATLTTSKRIFFIYLSPFSFSAHFFPPFLPCQLSTPPRGGSGGVPPAPGGSEPTWVTPNLFHSDQRSR